MANLLALWHWVCSHPYEFLMGMGTALSVLNGLLPAKVAAGPVGKVIHTVLDRLSVLTRTDSPGTLKWPVVGASVLQFTENTLTGTQEPK